MSETTQHERQGLPRMGRKQRVLLGVAEMGRYSPPPDGVHDGVNRSSLMDAD